MSIKYALFRQDGDIVLCDCCGQEVPTSVFENGFPPKDHRYCAVCAATMISAVEAYPTNYNHDTCYMMKQLAACTNILYFSIKRQKVGVLLEWAWRVTVAISLIVILAIELRR